LRDIPDRSRHSKLRSRRRSSVVLGGDTGVRRGLEKGGRCWSPEGSFVQVLTPLSCGNIA
jgi:hypothetical protein